MNTTESPSDSTAFDHSTSDTQTLEAVCDRLAELTERVETLETELKQKDERIETLEATVTEQDAILSAIRKKSSNTREMVRELQERELEKNAHLQWENVYPHKAELEITADNVEKFTKDDVEQTKRRGKKLVVVDPEAADRYHDRCDRANEHAPAKNVMS